MKIVIDIPENIYMVSVGLYKKGMSSNTQSAIATGIPIPLNHGRLIDETQITACEWDGKHMTCDAPTIVPGERSEE